MDKSRSDERPAGTRRAVAASLERCLEALAVEAADNGLHEVELLIGTAALAARAAARRPDPQAGAETSPSRSPSRVS